MIQQQNVNRRNEGLWNTILKVDSWRESFRRIIQQGWWMKLGDGNKTRFWEDMWIGESTLMDKYPRLVSVSLQKGGYDCKYGFLGWNTMAVGFYMEEEVIPMGSKIDGSSVGQYKRCKP